MANVKIEFSWDWDKNALMGGFRSRWSRIWHYMRLIQDSGSKIADDGIEILQVLSENTRKRFFGEWSVFIFHVYCSFAIEYLSMSPDSHHEEVNNNGKSFFVFLLSCFFFVFVCFFVFCFYLFYLFYSLLILLCK